MKKILVQKISEKYALDNGKYNITASVQLERKAVGVSKRITLNEGTELIFVCSKPEVVKAMGELILEASKL